MKNTHIIINLNKLHSVLESWYFFQNHDMKLLKQLQAVYHVIKDLFSFSAKINQIQISNQYDDILLLNSDNVSAHQFLNKLSQNQACNSSKIKYLKNNISSLKSSLLKIRISSKSCKSCILINEEFTEFADSHELLVFNFEQIKKTTWKFIILWIFLKFLT